MKLKYKIAGTAFVLFGLWLFLNAHIAGSSKIKALRLGEKRTVLAAAGSAVGGARDFLGNPSDSSSETFLKNLTNPPVSAFYAGIYNSDGDLVASSDPNSGLSTGEPLLIRSILKKGMPRVSRYASESKTGIVDAFIPFKNPSGVKGVFRLGFEELVSKKQGIINSGEILRDSILTFIPFLLIFFAAVSLFSKPFSLINEALRAASLGNTGVRLPGGGGAEFAMLADSFNSLVSRIDAENDVIGGISEYSSAMASATGPAPLFSAAAAAVDSLIKASKYIILIREGDKLRPVETNGIPTTLLSTDTLLPYDDSLFNMSVEEGKQLLFNQNSIKKFDCAVNEFFGGLFSELVLAPAICRDKVYGFLITMNSPDDGNVFSRRDLTVAGSVASALAFSMAARERETDALNEGKIITEIKHRGSVDSVLGYPLSAEAGGAKASVLRLPSKTGRKTWYSFITDKTNSELTLIYIHSFGDGVLSGLAFAAAEALSVYIDRYRKLIYNLRYVVLNTVNKFPGLRVKPKFVEEFKKDPFSASAVFSSVQETLLPYKDEVSFDITVIRVSAKSSKMISASSGENSTGLIRKGKYYPVHKGDGTKNGDVPVLKQIKLEPGDRIVCASSGITEITDPNGDKLGSEGLTKVLSSRPAAEDCGEFTKSVGELLKARSGDREPMNDITLVALKV
ncbi:MAG: SpoIIE family protein phosphatase [Fibrobacterota bacterium]